MKVHMFVGLLLGYLEAAVLTCATVRWIIEFWPELVSDSSKNAGVVLLFFLGFMCVSWLVAVHQNKTKYNVHFLCQDIVIILLLFAMLGLLEYIEILNAVKNWNEKQFKDLKEITRTAEGLLIYILWVCFKRFVYYVVWQIERAISSGEKTIRGFWYILMGYQNSSHLTDNQLNVKYEA